MIIVDVKTYVEESSDPWSLKKVGVDKRRLEIIKKYLSGKGLVLDLGCAFGTYTDIISSIGNTAIGIDFSERMVHDASEKFPKNTFLKADATKLPFDCSVFDCVLLMGTAIYIRDKTVMFKEINRILKPKGIVCIIERNRLSPWHLIAEKLRKESAVDKISDFIDIKQMKFLLAETGFRIRKISGDELSLPFFSRNRLTRKFFWRFGEIMPSASNFIVIIAEK